MLFTFIPCYVVYNWTFLPTILYYAPSERSNKKSRKKLYCYNDQTNLILHDGRVKFLLTKLSPMFVKYKGDFLSVTPSAVLAKYLHCLTSQVYKTSSQRWFYQAGCQVGLSLFPSFQIKEIGTSFAELPNPLLKHRRRSFPVL